MGREYSKQEEVQRKKRWKIVGLMMVCEILIVVYTAYCFYIQGWHKVSPKDELIKITGTIERYERIHGLTTGRYTTKNEYRIYMQNGDIYYMSGSAVTVFNRRDFEFYNHKGDEVTLWIDPNENTGFKPYIAEVWGKGEVCYLSYEDYKEASEKNSKSMRIFTFFFIPFCIGLCIYIDTKMWEKMKAEDNRVYYI